MKFWARDWNFVLDGLLSKPSVLGLVVRVPVGFRWPANLWTALRFFGLFFVWLGFSLNPVVGLLCFAACLYTDALDGLVARQFVGPKQEEVRLWLDGFYWLYVFDRIDKSAYDRIGEWFDPLADKVFVISCFYYFGLYLAPIVSWELFWVMVIIELSGRTIIIPLIRRGLMRRPLYIRANKLGKAKFISEAIVGLMIMLYYLWPGQWLILGVNGFIYVAIVLSVGSLLGHLWPEHFIKFKLLNPKKI